jgi:hypothetical protein
MIRPGAGAAPAAAHGQADRIDRGIRSGVPAVPPAAYRSAGADHTRSATGSELPRIKGG